MDEVKLETIFMNSIFYVSLFLLFFTGCRDKESIPSISHTQKVKAKAEDFFETFSDRTDWDKFCSFYREDLEFEDVILQIRLDSLWKFKRFYKWDEEGDRFRKLSKDQPHLTVHTLVVDKNVAVARGHVNPFYYDNQLIDVEWGMDFTIWLYFDNDLKISRQVDWFEYDSNVLENMIKRCRENGFEAIPEWLDLSK